MVCILSTVGVDVGHYDLLWLCVSGDTGAVKYLLCLMTVVFYSHLLFVPLLLLVGCFSL